MEQYEIDYNVYYTHKLQVKLKKPLSNGQKWIVCYGLIFSYEGAKYVHFREGANLAFDWLSVFNYEHRKVAEERCFDYTDCKSKSDIKTRFGFALDGEYFNYFGKWKSKWVSDNCLEVGWYVKVFEDYIVNEIGLK